MQSEFRNEPFTDFSREENAREMRAAIEKVKGELGREYPLVIGGERIKTEAKFESINPAKCRAKLLDRTSRAAHLELTLATSASIFGNATAASRFQS